MAHKQSSELRSLSNGGASSENGTYTDPLGLRKSKRLKVVNESSSEAKKDARELKNVVVGSSCKQSIIGTKQLRGRTVSVVLDSPPNMGSSCRQTTIGTKQLRGRTVPVVLDSPPNMWSKSLKSGKEQALVPENSDTRDHLGHTEDLMPLEPEKSKVTPRKGVLMSSPLKLSNEMNGDNGEGSGMKNSERDIRYKERLARKPRLPYPGLPSSRSTVSNSSDNARYKVKEALRLFHGACRKIIQEEEARPRERNGKHFRVDIEALKILKSKGISFSTGTPIMGHVPGVEVGDEFQYRMELSYFGIHRQTQAGIDYMNDDNNEPVATSIVSSGGYDDELDTSDVLTYMGQGGNIRKGKKCEEPKDQELVKGNLALANSKRKQNPVRVIKGNKKTASESSADTKNYVYDGLYLVENFWQETGPHGKLVFKFKLRRIPGQPELSLKVVKKSEKPKIGNGLYTVDISEGKEKLPICAVNTLNDEKPPEFIYTFKMIYPDWCKPIPPRSCGCTKRCSKSTNCSCIAKNGGELPYNSNGAHVSVKPVVYECGPHCKCPPSCYLRVAQRGTKFQLEIFKTESRGWGVRSRNSIPAESFVCEYAGELLDEKEAERLADNDEYLFDIGKDHEWSGFTIDAARKGNIGRFINHSCTPNLYAQDVLYDHEETRIAHVMFFALDDISPLEELSYDYNYNFDHVSDANGNIKKKYCYCGSSECTGRLY